MNQMQEKTRASFAADHVLKRGVVKDTCVSADMVYGVVHVGGQWFYVEIRRSDEGEVDAFFPGAREQEV